MNTAECNYSKLRLAVQNDRNTTNTALTSGSFIDSIFIVEPGSFIGRTLDQYEEILSHAGAPKPTDIIQRFKDATCPILDMGGGVGIVLAELKNRYPNIEPHLSDIRNTSLNKHKYTLEPFKIMHQEMGILFHQKSHLELVRDHQYKGYFGLITCVFAAYDDDNGPLLPFFIKKSRDMLKENGTALIFTNVSEQLHETTTQLLKTWGIDFYFYPADKNLLNMKDNGKITGTMAINCPTPL